MVIHGFSSLRGRVSLAFVWKFTIAILFVVICIGVANAEEKADSTANRKAEASSTNEPKANELTNKPRSRVFSAGKKLRRYRSERLDEINDDIKTRLPQLSQFSLQGGVGSIGYRSITYEDPKETAWIEIDLEQEVTIDEVVLVPTVIRDAVDGFVADGFPVRFRVVIGKGTKKDRSIVASILSPRGLQEGIAPVVIPAEGVRGSWVRIETVRMRARQYDDKFIFQLSEVLVFSDSKNVALKRPVSKPKGSRHRSPAWHEDFLVDGFLPFLMNSGTSKGTIAFLSNVGIGNEPTITIDLESEHAVEAIYLHMVEQADTVPQTYSGEFCIPGEMIIEGANNPDFSDATLLARRKHESSYDAGPTLCLQTKQHACRYVRLTAKSPFIFDFNGRKGSRIGFAEIEIYSNGNNVALNKAVSLNFKHSDPRRPKEVITDGLNQFGEILPLRKWIFELAERQELEIREPVIANILGRRHLLQRGRYRWLAGLAVALSFGTLLVAFFGWRARKRAVRRTRESIAADLHDELGANLNAIGLLSDLARKSIDSPDRLDVTLGRIHDLTLRTSAASASFGNLLESKELYEDVTGEMRRFSKRLTTNLEHDLMFEGEEHLSKLDVKRRIDLLLFHRECLTNTLRHSGATFVSTRLSASEDLISLVVADNGSGLPDSANEKIPSSLERRASLLGAKVHASKCESNGTRIEMSFPLKKRWARIFRK